VQFGLILTLFKSCVALHRNSVYALFSGNLERSWKSRNHKKER